MCALVSSGAVESVQIGRLRRVPADALVTFLDEFRAGRRGGCGVKRQSNGRSTIYEGSDGYWHGRVIVGLTDQGSRTEDMLCHDLSPW